MKPTPKSRKPMAGESVERITLSVSPADKSFAKGL
jgi:hypothetical protein